MGTNISKDYIERFIKNDSHEKTHIEVFLEFVSSIIFDGNEYSIEDFALLNANDLKESLEYYIRKNKITAKQTAGAYLGNLKKFFVNLETYYQVHNDIVVNGNFVPTFIEETERIISTLNDTVNTGVATDDEYQDLVKKLTNAETKYSYQQAVLEIDNYLDGKSSDNPVGFQRILSICAWRMVIEYGFKNKIIIDIKIGDIDLKKGIIKTGEYMLPIPNELKNNLCDYFKIRSYLLSKLYKSQEVLFIQPNGESIKDQNASEKLFTKVVGDSSSKESKPYAQRCIERMIKEGFSADIIKSVTGYGDTIYKKTCDFVNKENFIQNKLTEFIIPTRKKQVIKKHYINCPICNKEVMATSDNFVLIKKTNDDTLYLYCKECGEKEKVKSGRNDKWVI